MFRIKETPRLSYRETIYACVAGFALKMPLKLSRYCRKTRIHNTQATSAGAMLPGASARWKDRKSTRLTLSPYTTLSRSRLRAEDALETFAVLQEDQNPQHASDQRGRDAARCHRQVERSEEHTSDTLSLHDALSI